MGPFKRCRTITFESQECCRKCCCYMKYEFTIYGKFVAEKFKFKFKMNSRSMLLAFLFISFIGESLRIPFALEVPCWLEIRNSKLSENIQPRLSKIKVWSKLDEVLHYFLASLISLHYTSVTKVNVNSICKIWNILAISYQPCILPLPRKLWCQ